jgi:Co/Zn/Cd efflux system component
MHRVDHSHFRHSHDFVSDFSKGERRTRIVIAITGVMMVVEITAGLLSHSMALLADGWHMSTRSPIISLAAIQRTLNSVSALVKLASLAASPAQWFFQSLHF